jgi:nitroimidazol reductase NimA-like FMN-containing flavoprotein (pyridoxamine 5'-phosphate oxidase superfamily)
LAEYRDKNVLNIDFLPRTFYFIIHASEKVLDESFLHCRGHFMRKDIEKLITDNSVCVLATVSEGRPHCSFMSYATADDCREIYMVTQKATKKYSNLRQNPSVSLLIDSRKDDERSKTRALTVTGFFQGVASTEQKTQIRQRLLLRHPDLKTFFEEDDAEIIVVKVSTVQLLDGLKDAYFEEVT